MNESTILRWTNYSCVKKPFHVCFINQSKITYDASVPMFLFIAILNVVIHLTVWYLGTYIQEYHCLQMHGLKTSCPTKTNATIAVKN